MKTKLTFSLIFFVFIFSNAYGVWENISDINQYNIGKIWINPDNSNLYTAEGMDVLQSTDNGESWIKIFTLWSEYDDNMISEINIYNGLFVILTTHARLFLTRDLGASFERVVLNNGEEDIYFLYNSPNFHFWNNRILISLDRGIYESKDLGKNWTYITVDDHESNVYGIVTIPNGVFALFFNKIYFSEDLENWTVVNSAEIDDKWTEYHTAFSAEIASMGNMVFFEIGPYLFRTSNQGQNWDLVHEFESYSIEGQKYDTVINKFVSCDNIIYSTADINYSKNAGLFFSVDSGKTWENIIPGFREPFYPVINDSYLFVTILDGNGYSSFFRHELTDCLVDEVMGKEDKEITDILPPYPQPAKDKVSTEIYWDAPCDLQDALINVYDYTGRVVSRPGEIIFSRQDANRGVISWDCSGALQGAYFISIRLGGITKTIPLVVDR